MTKEGYTFYMVHRILNPLFNYIDEKIIEDIKYAKDHNISLTPKDKEFKKKFYYKFIVCENNFNKSRYEDESNIDEMILILSRGDEIGITFDNTTMRYTSVFHNYNINSRYVEFRLKPFLLDVKQLPELLLDIEEKLLSYNFYCEKYRDDCVYKVHKKYLWFIKGGY